MLSLAKLIHKQSSQLHKHTSSSNIEHNFPPTPCEIEAAGTAAAMAKRISLAAAPVLLAVALLLLASCSCHGRELKQNGAGAADSVTGGGGAVGEEKTLLGLPVPLPNLPLVPVPPVTGPLVPGVPPAARASTVDNKQSP
jgi:hypothetical protein